MSSNKPTDISIAAKPRIKKVNDIKDASSTMTPNKAASTYSSTHKISALNNNVKKLFKLKKREKKKTQKTEKKKFTQLNIKKSQSLSQLL
jgi:hypothetical protein